MLTHIRKHSIYDSRRTWAVAFIAVSIALVAVFLFISNRMVKDLAGQERDRMETWAAATKALATADSDQDIDLYLGIIERNHSIPVMLTDDADNILLHRNFHLPEAVDTLAPYLISERNMAFLEGKLQRLKSGGHKITLRIDANTVQNIYYEDSIVLRRLSYFPYIQLGVLLVFVIVVYLALMSIRRAEQNRVWVGLSKETAHQLGTPISSLMAWIELLSSMGTDPSMVADMNKDVRRLSIIADRFSKIGSKPDMEMEFINQAVEKSMEYMRNRISKRVVLTIHTSDAHNCGVMLCHSLFEWVMENLTKNAVDAMQGEGRIDITVSRNDNVAIIDVADTGKGIPHKNFKKVFHPGFTTKKRGWGLGLTLVKRIIEEYHGGKIYVKESSAESGTTFRIELPTV